jgi:hypothetical protein
MAKRHHAKMHHEKMHEGKDGSYSNIHHSPKNLDKMPEYYAGVDMRRRMEHLDGMMINEDRHAIANLPQHVVYREYSEARNYMPEHLDDTIRGVDNQIGMDDRERSRLLNPKKY